MRILVPLFKGLGIKPNLRRMLLAQSTLEAHRQGEPVRVVRGTTIKEVTEGELSDEVRIYSEAGLDQNVTARIRDMRRAYKARTDG